MDKFLIRSSGSEKSKSSQTDEKKRKSKPDRDREYDKKRIRTFQSTWLAEFPWLCADDKSDTVYCNVCRMFPQLADITSGLYVGKKVDRKNTLSTHQLSAKHVSCMSKFERKKVTGSLDRAFSKVDLKEVERYKKLFNTAFAVAKHNRPFSDYTFLCDVQKKNGVELGNDHLGRDACVDFLNSISSVMLEEVKENVKKVRFFSIMSDSSTDSAVIDQEGILLRYVHPDTFEPVTTVASIEKLENARAEGVVSDIKNGVLKCGIDIDTLGSDSSSPKLVCVNLDGAAVNMGAKNGVAKQLSDSVKNTVVVTHCVAHKLELGVLDAVKQVGYLKKFEDTVKRICKFYAYSPKRREELKNLASFLDETLIMHSEIKAIRWVASKLRALEAMCKDLNVTVTHMERILSTSSKADELGQAKAILSDLKQVKFVKYIYLMIDILSAITQTSKLFQDKDLLIFEVKEAIEVLYMKLHAMGVEPGEYLTRFYSLYDNNSSMFDGKYKLVGTLLAYKDDDDIHVLLDKMCQYILNRFSDLDKSPLYLFRVFDFRTWPSTLAELSTYGCSEIKSLCDEFSELLTEEDISCIPSEWQTLKVQVSMQRKLHPLAVFLSILQRQEVTVKHINVLLQLLLTISPSTASCERLFSSMNLVKSPLRTCLTQQNLQNQMHIVVNGKPFEDFDPQPALEFWLKSGHRHITHKPPVRTATVTSTEPCASTSHQAETGDM